MKKQTKYILILIALRLALLLIYLLCKLAPNGSMAKYSWWYVLIPECIAVAVGIVGTLIIFTYNTWRNGKEME